MTVHFDPPYRGQDRDSHFPRMVMAADMAHETLLVMDEDGILHVVDIETIQTDWRWVVAKKTWISVDDPDPDG